MDASGDLSRNPAPSLEGEVKELSDYSHANGKTMEANSEATGYPNNSSDVDIVPDSDGRREEEVVDHASSSVQYNAEESWFKVMFGYSRPARDVEPQGTQQVPYENLSDELKLCVDLLRGKIDKMPRRKLLDSLKREIRVEEIMPLITLDRDSASSILGISATTFKAWIHEGFGLKRWPYRAMRANTEHCLRLWADVRREASKADGNFDAKVVEKRSLVYKAYEERIKIKDEIIRAGHEARETFLSKIAK